MIERLEPVGIAVLILCNDKKQRMVKLDGKQPKQVMGYLTHIQGGKLRLHTEAVPSSADEAERRIIVPGQSPPPPYR